MLINREKFYDGIKKNGLFTSLTQSQVNGLNFILGEIEAEVEDTRWAAYMLATAYHETAKTMLPVKEYGGNAYYTKMYDIKGTRPKLALQMGNKNPGDGAKYCGRGYVQLTWYNNYLNMGKLLGVDLVGNPELAMDPKIAARIMIEGMTKGQSTRGDFTGVSLENYFNSNTTDWVNARRVINGLDRAKDVATYAQKFNSVLA
ncbi:glycoside hydrolase family 19 chitinase protein [Rhizobium phage RHph_TM3_3_6]|nr:glycoside hydrolase family 19 chitinase protein [Rhizobium phage RHph_TM3_3_6]